MTISRSRRRFIPAVLGGALVAAAVAVVPAGAVPTWLAPPVTLVQGEPGPNGAELVVDAAGNATAAWAMEGTPMTVLASTHPVGGTWSAPTTVASSSQIGSNMDLAVNAAGTVIAVWTQFGDSTFQIHSATRPAGGAWSAPMPVSDGVFDAFQPQVVVDAAGNAVATWQEVDGYLFLRYATKSSAGPWSAVDDLSVFADGPVQQDHSLAITPDGQATAAWSIDFDDATPGRLIQSSVRPAGGSFGAPVIVSSDTTNTVTPSLAVSAGGVATVAWREEGEQIKAATRAANGTWSDPQDVSAAGGVNLEPDVAVDAGGTSTAIWARDESGEPGKLQYSTRPPGGAWSAPQELDASADTAYEIPSLAIDGGGRMTAAYVADDAVGDSVWATTRAPGGSWTPPVLLSASASDTIVNAVNVGMDDVGQAVVAWVDRTGVVESVQARALDSAGPLATGVSIPASATAGQPVQFSWPAIDAWSPVTSVVWAFGDGSTGSGASVTKIYSAGSTYAVSVTATDAVGNATTRTGTIVVAPGSNAVMPKPVLTGVKLTKKTIHVLKSDEKPRATKLKLTLNVDAKVVVKLKRTQKLKGKVVKAKLAKSLDAGKRGIRLTSKVGGKKLPPGTYKVTVFAKNAAGKSAAKTVRLKIVR